MIFSFFLRIRKWKSDFVRMFHGRRCRTMARRKSNFLTACADILCGAAKNYVRRSNVSEGIRKAQDCFSTSKSCNNQIEKPTREKAKRNFSLPRVGIFGSKFIVYCDDFPKGQPMSKSELTQWLNIFFKQDPDIFSVKQTQGGYLLEYVHQIFEDMFEKKAGSLVVGEIYIKSC